LRYRLILGPSDRGRAQADHDKKRVNAHANSYNRFAIVHLRCSVPPVVV
jgi:hypothetical protein